EGNMDERPSPIFFWHGMASNTPEPYIDPELQKGTTPLVKLSGGIGTRNFKNFKYSDIQDGDRAGARAILDNRYKLIIHGGFGDKAKKELFDVREDPAEEHNLITTQEAVAEKLEQQLRNWQQSVLESLM